MYQLRKVCGACGKASCWKRASRYFQKNTSYLIIPLVSHRVTRLSSETGGDSLHKAEINIPCSLSFLKFLSKESVVLLHGVSVN